MTDSPDSPLTFRPDHRKSSHTRPRRAHSAHRSDEHHGRLSSHTDRSRRHWCQRLRRPASARAHARRAERGSPLSSQSRARRDETPRRARAAKWCCTSTYRSTAARRTRTARKMCTPSTRRHRPGGSASNAGVASVGARQRARHQRRHASARASSCALEPIRWSARTPCR